MIDQQHFAKWLDAYVAAWHSYDPQAIGELFSADAVYRYSPFDEPLQGREAIVASWLEDRDQPGSFAAQYAPLAVNGDTGVMQGRTQYFRKDGKTVAREYDNIWVVRFDAAGKCADFCEWYMKRGGGSRVRRGIYRNTPSVKTHG